MGYRHVTDFMRTLKSAKLALYFSKLYLGLSMSAACHGRYIQQGKQYRQYGVQVH